MSSLKITGDLPIEKKYQLLLEENQRLKQEIYELKLKYEPPTKPNRYSSSSPINITASITPTQQSPPPSSSFSSSAASSLATSPIILASPSSSSSSSTATSLMNNYPIQISSSSYSSSEDLTRQLSNRESSKKDRKDSNDRENSKSDKSRTDKGEKKHSTSVGKKWINKLLDSSNKKLSTSSTNLNISGNGVNNSGGSSKKETSTGINHQELINGNGNEADFIYQEKGLSTPYLNLPKLEVIPINGGNGGGINGLSYFTGPDYSTGIEPITTTGTPMTLYPSTYSERLYCLSTSTYPFLPNTTQRAGDPIADRYTCAVYNNRLITCLADGCNWGQKPKEAAQNASTAFIDYVISQNDNMTNVKEVGKILFNAFECAHKSIMLGKDEFWEAGTTTLLGGVLLEINKGSDKWSPQWEFVCASVGDCKAFLLSQGEITDITEGNRSNLDAKDCGGRLGPHLEQGKPDLRNLNIFCASVYDEDIIMIVSDGVHDNLDPRHLGKLPNEMSKEFNIQGDKWSDVDFSKAQIAKNAFTASLLETLTSNSTSPTEISNRIIEHCWNTTISSRYWMESNVGKRLPEDYTQYPGKMDHTSIVCFKVGHFGINGVNNNNNGGSSTGDNISSRSNSTASSTSAPSLCNISSGDLSLGINQPSNIVSDNSISGEPFHAIAKSSSNLSSLSPPAPTPSQVDWIKVSPSHNKNSSLKKTSSESIVFPTSSNGKGNLDSTSNNGSTKVSISATSHPDLNSLKVSDGSSDGDNNMSSDQTSPRFN